MKILTTFILISLLFITLSRAEKIDSIYIVKELIESIQKNDLSGVIRNADLIAICTCEKETWTLISLLHYLGGINLEKVEISILRTNRSNNNILIRVKDRNIYHFEIIEKKLRKGLDRPVLAYKVCCIFPILDSEN